MNFIESISINKISHDMHDNLQNQYNRHSINKQAKNAEVVKYLLIAHNCIKNAGFEKEAQEILSMINAA